MKFDEDDPDTWSCVVCTICKEFAHYTLRDLPTIEPEPSAVGVLECQCIRTLRAGGADPRDEEYGGPQLLFGDR